METISDSLFNFVVEEHGFAEETGQTEVEATAAGIDDYLTNWDPETPIKPARRNSRKRRDTGNFLKIHMKMQTLDDTPNTSVGTPSDPHVGVRRSRRIRRKSMQLQQMVPPTGVEMEEGNSEIPAARLDATFVVTPPAPPVDNSPCVDFGSDGVNAERTFVTLHCFRQCELIPSRDVMATDQSAMTTTKYPPEQTEWVDVAPSEDSSDTSNQRSKRRRRCIQRVDIVETDASPQTPQKRPKKQERGKKPEPVDPEELHSHRSQMPVENEIETTIPEEDGVMPIGPESSRVMEVSHVAIRKRGRPRKIRQQARPQRLTRPSRNEEMTALLSSNLHACGDELQTCSESLSNSMCLLSLPD